MWLLASEVRKRLEDAVAVGFIPTADQQASFFASRPELTAGPSNSRIMSTAGTTAEVLVKGVLTQSPDFMAYLFGGGNTTYPEIDSALAEAEADPEVKTIYLKVDSPGGSIDGLFDTLAAMEAITKPIHAVVSNQAASAAYAIVSKADSIRATNRAARFGSIGVVAGMRVDDSVVEITSTNAPNKRPDVTTPEGVATLVGELDALEEIFIESIATGRKTTTEKVIADFGQGGMLTADAALEKGMIDQVGKSALTVVPSTKKTNLPAASVENNLEEGPMDVKTLETSHPETYAAVLLKGVTAERDRAAAHITAGEMSGSMDTALAAVKDGTEMTQTLSMQYVMAAANQGHTQNRLKDEQDLSGLDNLDPEAQATQDEKTAAAVLQAAATACGVEMGN